MRRLDRSEVSANLLLRCDGFALFAHFQVYQRNLKEIEEEASHLDVKSKKATKAALKASKQIQPSAPVTDVVNLALSPRRNLP